MQKPCSNAMSKYPVTIYHNLDVNASVNGASLPSLRGGYKAIPPSQQAPDVSCVEVKLCTSRKVQEDRRDTLPTISAMQRSTSKPTSPIPTKYQKEYAGAKPTTPLNTEAPNRDHYRRNSRRKAIRIRAAIPKFKTWKPLWSSTAGKTSQLCLALTISCKEYPRKGPNTSPIARDRQLTAMSDYTS